MDISARTLEDPENTFNQNTDGENEEIDIEGLENKYLEIGKNLNGFIHDIVMNVGSAEAGTTGFWRTQVIDYQLCYSNECAHTMSCLGYTNTYPDNQCLLCNIYIYKLTSNIECSKNRL